METDNLNLWFWVAIILFGIISAIIGYLIGKSKAPKVLDLTPKLNALESENTKLKTDLEACNKKLESGPPQAEATAPSVSLSAKEVPPVKHFDVGAAKDAMGKRIKQDDLKIVEGIGPKIEGLFHNFNIKTWKDLSEASTDQCQKVLDSGGDRYRIHDPASWPMQAKMAYEGQWKQLKKWQDDHKAGKY
nr:hypothetical protein [Allomuricauda sp.]